MIPVLRGANIPRQQGANSFVPGGFDYESDVDAYSVYADVAGSIPTLGASGATDVTIAYNTASPLTSYASLDIVKPSGNRQGVSIASTFKIGLGNRGTVLRLSFQYAIASGNFPAGTSSVDSNLTAYIYDVTNAKLIPLSDHKLYSNSAVSATFNGVFQTSIDSIDYKLILFIGTTDSNAWTMKIDELIIAPLAISPTTVITDWVEYTPSFGASYGAVTNIYFFWRRKGNKMQIKGVCNVGICTSGTDNSIGLPADITIDSSKEGGGTGKVSLGLYYRNSSANYVVYNNTAGAVVVGVITYSISDLTKLQIAPYVSSANTSIFSVGGVATNSFFNNGDMLSIDAEFTVAGWGSSLSSALTGDDGRVVAARYTGLVAANSSPTTPLQWNTKDYDTHNSVTTGSSWKFVAPIAGVYAVKCAYLNSAGSIPASLYRNGVQVMLGAHTSAGFFYGNSSYEIYCSAGDYLDVRFDVSDTAVASSNFAVAISRVAGNAVASMLTGAGATAFTSITTEYSSASTTWVQVLSQAITPKYASSKICIRAIVNFLFYTDNSIQVSARILKDGTPIATFTNIAAVEIGTPIAPTQNTPFEWTEDAGSVASRTYTIEFRRESYAGGYGGTVYVNQGNNRTSTLKLIEEIQ